MNSDETKDTTAASSGEIPDTQEVKDTAETSSNTPKQEPAEGTPVTDTTQDHEESSPHEDDDHDSDEVDGDDEALGGETVEVLRDKLAHVAKQRRKTNRENENLRARLKQAEHDINCYQVASELHIPAQLASRLKGDTVEDLKKDAESLLEALGGFGVSTGLGTNFPENEAQDTDPLSPQMMDEIGARIYRR